MFRPERTSGFAISNVALHTLRSAPTWPFTLSEVLQPVCFSVIHNVSNASAKCENMQWVSILKTLTLDSELFEVRLLFLELFEAFLLLSFPVCVANPSPIGETMQRVSAAETSTLDADKVHA
jgi:hypothetical protein